MSCNRCKEQAKASLGDVGASAATADAVFASGQHAADTSNTCSECGVLSTADPCRKCVLTMQLQNRNGGDGATTSLAQVKGTLMRCRSCGRYASMDKTHTCPVASSPDDLAKALSRRIGGDVEKLYGKERIEALFAEAAEAEDHAIQLTHPYSGIPYSAELDALPVLMEAGYLPNQWAGETKYAVVGKDGRCYQAFDLDDKLSFAPLEHDPIREAAQAYGMALPENVPVLGASSPLWGVPFLAQYNVNSPDTAKVFVMGGEAKNAADLHTREFARRNGNTREAWPGSGIDVGMRKQGPYGSPLRPAPINRVTVGRTYPMAAYLFMNDDLGAVVGDDGTVEVYSVDENGGTNLEAVYDPVNRAVGTTDLESDMTPAQSLALAFGTGGYEFKEHFEELRRLYRRGVYDGGVQNSNGVVSDTTELYLQAADSMYHVISEDLKSSPDDFVFVTGAVNGVSKCPDCGQFMGQLAPHHCPGGPKNNQTKPEDLFTRPDDNQAQTSTPTVDVTALMDQAGKEANKLGLVALVSGATPGDKKKHGEFVSMSYEALERGLLGTVAPNIAVSELGFQLSNAGFSSDAIAYAQEAVSIKLGLKDPGTKPLLDTTVETYAKLFEERGLKELTRDWLTSAITVEHHEATGGGFIGDARDNVTAMLNGIASRANGIEAKASGAEMPTLADVFLIDRIAQDSANLLGSGTSLDDARQEFANTLGQYGFPDSDIADNVLQKCDQCGRFYSNFSGHDCPASQGQSASNGAANGTGDTAVQSNPQTAASDNNARFFEQSPTNIPGVRPGAKNVTPVISLSQQEFIMKDVVAPAPDPWLSNVPKDMGGQLTAPIGEAIPSVKSDYYLDSTAERVLATMSASIQLSYAVAPEDGYKMRSFGLYGPAGTGKNTLLKQLAASIRTREADGSVKQGVGYHEITVSPEMVEADVIGSATLEATPEGGTRSVVKLGPVGMAAATGSVIAINEIVRNPKLATAFQSIMEDGKIIINSPEAGTITIPVHPATVIAMTWNPGNEGDADRPALAPLARMFSFRLPRPSKAEMKARAALQFKTMGMQINDLGKINDDAAKSKASLRNSYKIPDLSQLVHDDDTLEKCTSFWMDVQDLAAVPPESRELARFAALGPIVGWHDAANIFQIYCDQDEDFDDQWARIKERAIHYFGY